MKCQNGERRKEEVNRKRNPHIQDEQTSRSQTSIFWDFSTLSDTRGESLSEHKLSTLCSNNRRPLIRFHLPSSFPLDRSSMDDDPGRPNCCDDFIPSEYPDCASDLSPLDILGCLISMESKIDRNLNEGLVYGSHT
jgi:hypothetical protein